MNWFFHKVYWTGWISNHHKRRRSLLSADAETALAIANRAGTGGAVHLGPAPYTSTPSVRTAPFCSLALHFSSTLPNLQNASAATQQPTNMPTITKPALLMSKTSM